MRLFSLFLALGLLLPPPASAQGESSRGGQLPTTVDGLIEAARETDSGQRFASAVAQLVRRSNEAPAQAAAPTVAYLTEVIRSGSTMKRSIAVDALKSLPANARNQFVPILTEMIRGGGDTPRTRLFVRGLGEIGEQGRTVLQQLLSDGALSGTAASRARFYVNG